MSGGLVFGRETPGLIPAVGICPLLFSLTRSDGQFPLCVPNATQVRPSQSPISYSPHTPCPVQYFSLLTLPPFDNTHVLFDFMFCIRLTAVQPIYQCGFTFIFFQLLLVFNQLHVCIITIHHLTIIFVEAKSTKALRQLLNREQRIPDRDHVSSPFYPARHRWKTLCHAVACRNLSMKEWFLPTQTAAVRGGLGSLQKQSDSVVAPPAFQSLLLRDLEALNIPRG